MSSKTREKRPYQRRPRSPWKRVKKRLYQRFWGGRAPAETPVVLFLAGDSGLDDGQLIGILESSLETDVYRSGDARAFEDGALRPDEVLRTLIGRSRAPAMVFVLDEVPPGDRLIALVQRFQPARALWIYEDYERYVRDSAQGPTDRLARTRLRHLVDGGEGQLADVALTSELVALAHDESLDSDAVRALLWYDAHARYRRQGMHRERAIHLFGGDQLRLTPKETMTTLLEAAGIGTAVLDSAQFRTGSRSRRQREVELPAELDNACESLQIWLDQQGRP